MNLLAEHLRQANQAVTTTREPGGTSLGETVRRVILAKQEADLSFLSELSLFISCRAQLSVEVIEPALKAGDTVLSSRYRLSSLAYQGYGRGLDLALIDRLNEIATHGRQPDITFLIDLPASKALERRGRSSDRIEQEDSAFYNRVRTGYLELTKGDPRVHLIDGEGSIDSIARVVRDILGV